MGREMGRETGRETGQETGQEAGRDEEFLEVTMAAWRCGGQLGFCGSGTGGLLGCTLIRGI